MERMELNQNDIPPRVVVIGGGISGLACARTLHDAGLDCMLIDRGRRVGGRISTKSHIHNGKDIQFNHGATKAEIRTHVFRNFVQDLQSEGVAELAEYPDGPVCVGVDSMQAIAQSLAEGLCVHSSSEVTEVHWEENAWFTHIQRYGQHNVRIESATHLVFACPLIQANRVFEASEHQMPEDLLAFCESHQAWSCMFLVESDSKLHELPCWIHSDQSDVLETLNIHQVSDGVFSIVAQSKRDPSFQDDHDVAVELMSSAMDELRRYLKSSVDHYRVRFVKLHRWGLAFPARLVESPFYFDRERRLGFCGDSFTDEQTRGPSVESAFLSGKSLGKSMLDELVCGNETVS
jgi:renalase